MNFIHKDLAKGKWFEMTFCSQMANIGAEVSRMIYFKNANNQKLGEQAFERVFDLFDLTIIDKKNKNRLKEVLRAREALADYFYSKNTYKTTETFWKNYFLGFALGARVNNL